MALSPAFTTSQTIGAPSIMVITDTSTGSDGAITQRRVYLQKSDGTYLVPSGTSTNYIEWDYGDASISIDVLDVDYALNITIQWLNNSNVVLYTETTPTVFTLYSEQFYYSLTQALAANYTIIADQNYYANKSMLRVEIDSANQAISLGGDVAASQACLNRAQNLIANSNYYY